LGPACWSVEMLVKMIDAGMNIARLNFSHGSHEIHLQALENLREAMRQRPNNHVSVMLDTKGPEIRTGFLENHKEIEIVKDQLLEITTDYEFLGTSAMIACSYQALPRSVQIGSVVLVADGKLVLQVEEIRETSIICRSKNHAIIGERKNMNLPGQKVELPTLTDKDVDDIVNFGVRHQLDFIAVSFVRSAENVEQVRELLNSQGEIGRNIKIISKIENQEGLHNFDQILTKTDGVMVARGDLGMEIPPEKVFLAQKMMIRKSNIWGKPVITATQMMESMIHSPRPTRAECSDVANAVFDGTDCVMLSGETAQGDYPINAVEIMAKTCCEAEQATNYDQLHQAVRNSTIHEFGVMTPMESIASSAVKTAIDVHAKMIVVLSESGHSARLIAKYRPSMLILVITTNAQTARQSEGWLKNCRSRLIESFMGTEQILVRAIEIGLENQWIERGEQVVFVHGTQEAVQGSTNLMRVSIA
jgi:pyruvate kinase